MCPRALCYIKVVGVALNMLTGTEVYIVEISRHLLCVPTYTSHKPSNSVWLEYGTRAGMCTGIPYEIGILLYVA
jgi:hypothetical protein